MKALVPEQQPGPVTGAAFAGTRLHFGALCACSYFLRTDCWPKRANMSTSLVQSAVGDAAATAAFVYVSSVWEEVHMHFREG